MLPQTDAQGRIYSVAGGTPAVWNAGIGYDAQGRMCTTTTTTGSDARLKGWRLDPQGRVVVAAAAPAFDPATLFALGEQGAWYDPTDLSTMFQDSAGTVPVTAVGQPVGRINDKSGRGNFAAQATAGKRPTLQIDGTGRQHLLFDGVDDSMSTAAFAMGTNKVTACAGVHKVSDAASGVVFEFSVQVGVPNPGSYAMFAPQGTGTPTQSFRSAGTAAVDNIVAGAVAPITNVLTGIGSITPPSNILRRNAVEVGNLATSQGTGNYGSYALFIGMRANTSVPLNGRIYGVVIRSAASTAQQIADTEAWMNGKTGAY